MNRTPFICARYAPLLPVLLFFAALTTLATPLQAVAQAPFVIEARYSNNGRPAVKSFAGGPGTVRAVKNANYSLHAAATAAGMADVRHRPAQVAPLDTFFPTAFGTGNIRSSIDATRTGTVGKIRTPPAAYATLPKSFNPANTDMTAMATAMAGTTSTSAIAVANFDEVADGAAMIPRITAAGTKVDVVKGNMAGSAGALVLDPVFFDPVSAGDQFFFTLGLSQDAFQFTVPEVGDIAAGVTEVGANLPNISAGSIGLSQEGNPLLFRLSIAFSPDNDGPLVAFERNQALNGSISGFGIFEPGTNNPLTDLGIYARLSDHVDRTGNVWTLDVPSFDLFEVRATFTADSPNFQVDYAHGLIVAVPEPTGAALGLAAAAALFVQRRVRPRDRSLN